MLEDAEKNAMIDKSKKSLVNITYEFDNLLLKAEKLIESFPSLNKSSIQYFEELVKETKMLYLNNKLDKIFRDSLKDLKYAYSVLVLDFLKAKLADSDKGDSGSDDKGVVIDVTEE